MAWFKKSCQDIQVWATAWNKRSVPNEFISVQTIVDKPLMAFGVHVVQG